MIAIPQFIKTALTGNQFATGGVLMVVLGAVIAQLRNIPSQISEWFFYHIMMTVTITDDSQAHLWFKWWFNNHPRAAKIRHVDVYTPRNAAGLREAFIAPAPGAHWFMFKGRPFRLFVTRTEEKAFGTTQRNEKIFVQMFGRNRAIVNEFIQDIHKTYLEKAGQDAVKLLLWSSSYWEEFPFEPRPLDSVILKKGVKESIVADIEQFKADHTWYQSTGMPYHRSYLLYGPPGTGKTSTLLGIASNFKANIHLLKLAQMNDSSLLNSLQNVRQNSMVILEDVDCLVDARAGVNKKSKKKRAPKKTRKDVYNLNRPTARETEEEDPAETETETKTGGVTLSGLLNALDGIETPSGAMFFLTTNVIERLDPALLRPGRVDMKVFIGEADDDQKTQMFARFFPTRSVEDAKAFILAHPEAKTMAAFQEQLKLDKIKS